MRDNEIISRYHEKTVIKKEALCSVSQNNVECKPCEAPRVKPLHRIQGICDKADRRGGHSVRNCWAYPFDHPCLALTIIILKRRFSCLRMDARVGTCKREDLTLFVQNHLEVALAS